MILYGSGDFLKSFYTKFKNWKIFSGPPSRKGKIAATRRTRRCTITMIEPIGHEPESENSDMSQKKI